MKVELWKDISTEYIATQTNNIDIDINYIALERRGSSSRYTYHCQVLGANSRLSAYDLVIATHGTGKNISEFFAIITDLRSTSMYRFCFILLLSIDSYFDLISSAYQNFQTTFFTMEASPVNGNKNITATTKKIKIKTISNLKTDIKTFDTVLKMPRSPLLNNILNPMINALPIETDPKLIKYIGKVRNSNTERYLKLPIIFLI